MPQKGNGSIWNALENILISPVNFYLQGFASDAVSDTANKI